MSHNYRKLDSSGDKEKLIIYCLVARGTVVLAEETLAMQSGKRITGNFHTVLTAKLLPKFPSEDGRYSFIYEKIMFHYINEDGVTYLCMCDVDTKRRLAFGFLETVKNSFLLEFRDKVDSAITYGMNAEFAPALQNMMKHWNDPNNDKMSRAQKNIESVKGVMIQNIESIMERGEKIEILVDRTESLVSSAQHFRHQGATLRKTMWWRNVRWALCLSIPIFIVVSLIVLLFYSFFKSDDDK